MQRGGSDQFPIWMARLTVFAGKLNSDVGKEFYVFQIQSIGRCHRWRITVRGLKWTIRWNWRNKETRTVDSRIEQSSRLEQSWRLLSLSKSCHALSYSLSWSYQHCNVQQRDEKYWSWNNGGLPVQSWWLWSPSAWTQCVAKGSLLWRSDLHLENRIEKIIKTEVSLYWLLTVLAVFLERLLNQVIDVDLPVLCPSSFWF